MKNLPSRLCIVAHYDKDSKIDEYVKYYVEQLEKVCNKIILVSVSNLSDDEIKKIKSPITSVINRENVGYDFYSYKVGLESINCENYNEILICNDSVYGPLIDIELIFDKMKDSKADFWGITSSNSLNFHIQSYFIVFRKQIIMNEIFKQFWKNLKVLDNKEDIIKSCEVGLSQLLYKNNFKSDTYVKDLKLELKKSDNFKSLITKLLKSPLKIFKLFLRPKQYINALNRKDNNPSLSSIKKQIVENRPFLKVSMFTKDSDKNTNLNFVINKLKLHFNYNSNLITKHCLRILRIDK